MNYGIICEYNPFHNGHKYQIEKTKEENDNIICVMSGQYVQRSCPSLFDKWSRATWAIKNGADLVIELPTVFSTSSAEFFAKGGVCILNSIGICDYISFGCENDDIKKFVAVCDIFDSKEYLFALKDFLNKGNNYPLARQKAVELLLKEDASFLSKPNNILGIEYIKALKNLKSLIKPVGIKRAFVSHDGKEETDTFASASNIREKIHENQSYLNFIPENIRDDIKEKVKKNKFCNCDEFYKACYRKLLNTTSLKLSENPYIGEGLEHKFLKEINNSTCYHSLLENVKSKRYAYSRLKRIMLSNYLEITKDDINSPLSYIRILAFNDKGRELLKDMKKKSSLPIITKPAHVKNCSQKIISDFEKENRFTNLSFSFYNNDFENNLDYKTSPIFIK